MGHQARRKTVRLIAGRDEPLVEEHRTSVGSKDASDAEIEAKVQMALDRLDPSLQAILNIRFGLHTGQPSSSTDIAKQIGVKDSQVQSLEDEALRVLMGYYKRNGKPPSGGFSQ